MARFAYKAIDSKGQEKSGVIEAESESEAVNEIGRRGLFLEEVRTANLSDDIRLAWHDQRQKRESAIARRQRQQQSRRDQARQRLVVRYMDGRRENGVSFALKPKEPIFHLDEVDEEGVTTGKTHQVRFSDLKAVFFVKSFDGNFDKSAKFREWTPEGTEMVVEFRDGEIIRGTTLHRYNELDERFYLVPEDQTSNNISILVEAAAVVGVYTADEYKERRSQEKASRKKEDVSADLSQEETMGDFYFETRNYPAALEQYKAAARMFPHSGRLRKKSLASVYNIGVQFIKRREYAEALEYMERILQVDPENAHARKKVTQLRRIIERGSSKNQ